MGGGESGLLMGTGSPFGVMWAWVNSGSWWWTGRPGVLRLMGSKRVGHDWATELNWTESICRAGIETQMWRTDLWHIGEQRGWDELRECHWHIHMAMCETDSSWGAAVQQRGPAWCPVTVQRGGMVGRGEGAPKGRNICTHMADSKSWKMMLWKCCTQYASKFGKLSSGHRAGKGQFSFQSQRKALPKNVQTTAQLHSSHTLVK